MITSDETAPSLKINEAGHLVYIEGEGPEKTYTNITLIGEWAGSVHKIEERKISAFAASHGILVKDARLILEAAQPNPMEFGNLTTLDK